MTYDNECKEYGPVFNFSSIHEEISKISDEEDHNQYEKNYKLQKKNNWRYCTNCNIEATEDTEISLSCPKCGLQIDIIHDSTQNFQSNTQYNTSNNNITTKMEGKNTYKYNKTLHSTCGQNNWNPKLIIQKLNNHSYETEENKIPEFIIQTIVEQFKKIREIETSRGNGQMAKLACLIYYECKRSKIAYKPKEIAAICKISERDMSKADSKLRALHENGIIKLELNNNNYESYIERYLSLLNINSENYDNIENLKNIILDIILHAEKKHIYIIKTPKPSTKCIGAIYLLINSIPEIKELITKEFIVKQCKISKTTFIGHYQLLLDNKKHFKKIFKRYGLEFPK